MCFQMHTFSPHLLCRVTFCLSMYSACSTFCHLFETPGDTVVKRLVLKMSSYHLVRGSRDKVLCEGCFSLDFSSVAPYLMFSIDLHLVSKLVADGGLIGNLARIDAFGTLLD